MTTKKDETFDALHALGPRAVQILTKALDGDGNLGHSQVEAARDILDRMTIRATWSSTLSVDVKK